MSAHPSAGDCHDLGGNPGAEAIYVLGIGNVLWADEGFGVRCIEALQRRYEFAPHVQLIDGGTQGLYLIQHVQAATRLLIFDAIDYGLTPGTLPTSLASLLPARAGLLSTAATTWPTRRLPTKWRPLANACASWSRRSPSCLRRCSAPSDCTSWRAAATPTPPGSWESR